MLLEERTTYSIIGAARSVYDQLANGFLENAYVGAMERECRKQGLRVEREVPTAVYYDGVVVASYRVDLMIEGRIIVEVKAVRTLTPDHFRQTLNYLRCTDCEVGLLINFGPKLEVKRFVYRNSLKKRNDT